MAFFTLTGDRSRVYRQCRVESSSVSPAESSQTEEEEAHQEYGISTSRRRSPALYQNAHSYFHNIILVQEIQYMAKSMWTPALIPKSRALIWSWSALCCYNSPHSSGKAFH
ncbi:hypothetical protein J4Q44_G00165310 [Coregonus suidteri]|uniref:Uncharacterized protein n=1 Tax=Coregonus suidteri TaxID=861788 RepID=A0AAN8LN75_9TELE